MISDSNPWRGGRVLRIALGLSLLAHLLLAVLWVFGTAVIARVAPRALPPPKTEVVTTSSAVRLERRAKPRPPLPTARRATIPARPQPPRPRQDPGRIALAPLPLPRPPPAARRRPEIARERPAAAPAPPRLATPQAIAVAPRAPAAPSKPSQFSEERLAQMEREFAQTIAQTRREHSISRISTEPPAAPKRYSVQMRGTIGDVSHYQGLCDPIKSWGADGFDYYYVTCHIIYPDGNVHDDPVPWPVRFRPNADPFNGTLREEHAPLHLPLAGWALAPNQYLTEGLRWYLRVNGVAVKDRG